MNLHIFREYDIRGIAETDLTDPVIAAIGRAYGTYIQEEGGSQVVVGRDVRLSSGRIEQALIRGILATGCDVLDIGVVPTPVFYFAIIHYGKDGGITVTGSHNPREYNGLKICKGTEALYGPQIQALRQRLQEGRFQTGQGALQQANPVVAYGQAINDRINLGQRRFKVVIDAGNGTAGEIAPDLLAGLGFQVVRLYCEPDGRFPNHLPDPTVPALMKDLQARVTAEGEAIGIGYDGDGDRIGAIDEKGRMVSGDQLVALFARAILEQHRGASIIFDVKCSQGLVEDVEAHGGKPVMSATGHSLIKARMKELSAPLAGELSGHICFADRYFGFDDAIYASLRLLEILSYSERSLADLVEDLPTYYATPEIRLGCADERKFAVVAQIRDHYQADHQVIDIDGARILFEGGWGLVRASNTQPVIVLRFEAKTPQRLAAIQAEVTTRLKSYPGVQDETVP